MSDDQSIESLVALCLQRIEESGNVAIESLCAEHPGHADELRARIRLLVAAGLVGTRTFGSGAATGDDLSTAPSTAARLAKLRSHAVSGDRYVMRGEVARGGMGAILRVHDSDLDRTTAMKVILGQDRCSTGETPGVDPRTLERFVDEALITGQLDHPGVVPVHELGVNGNGQVYFTMRLVKGKTADTIFELARGEKEGWTSTRALEVLIKVCDTLAYAHSKGVIHRDLKPTNVMVGAFGEVYVMDWGLAKVLGQPDRRDLRVATTSNLSEVRSDRRRAASSSTDSPLVTMDGTVIGTPSYMAPEQAEGRIADVDERSDVYAIGAMLYTLLTGWQPYVPPGAMLSPHTVLAAVVNGAPKHVLEIDPNAPPELVAVCERAMARDASERYADMRSLADAIRAYLERGVRQSKRTLLTSRIVGATQAALGVAWGLAVSSAALLILVFALGDFGFSGLPLSFEIPADHYGIAPRQGGEPVHVADCSGSIQIPSSSPLFGIAFVTGLVPCLCAAVILYMLKQVIAAVRAGTPFAEANVRRLRWVGWAILTIGVEQSLVSTVGPSLLRSEFDIAGLDLVDHETILFFTLPFRADYRMLFTGLAVLVLAEVFRLGSALDRREHEDTGPSRAAQTPGPASTRQRSPAAGAITP